MEIACLNICRCQKDMHSFHSTVTREASRSSGIPEAAKKRAPAILLDRRLFTLDLIPSQASTPLGLRNLVQGCPGPRAATRRSRPTALWRVESIRHPLSCSCSQLPGKRRITLDRIPARPHSRQASTLPRLQIFMDLSSRPCKFSRPRFR